jgi:glycosyltransferase involved in cell wall biosynthesis
MTIETSPHISVVMPAFNEAEILATSVKEVVTGLRERGDTFEVIIVENGSSDRTLAIALEIAAELPEVRVEHRTEANYGRALRAGVLAARGDAVVNFDIDYFDLEFLDAAVAKVLAPDGPAIVVGSKRAVGATDTRVPLRKIATWVFATVLRVLFGLKVSDTHGMKAMRRSAVVDFAEQCFSGQDLFDTELILRVERARLGTGEIAVTCHELRPARSSFLSRVPRTLRGLCRLRIAMWREKTKAESVLH